MANKSVALCELRCFFVARGTGEMGDESFTNDCDADGVMVRKARASGQTELSSPLSICGTGRVACSLLARRTAAA